MSRSISKKTRKQISYKQLNKCANTPNISLKGLEGYECPLWISHKHNGYFDESGYDIDHIVEYCISQDSSINNLQALCKCCHGCKTNRFASKYKKKVNNNNKTEKYEKIDNQQIDELYNKSMDIYDNSMLDYHTNLFYA